MRSALRIAITRGDPRGIGPEIVAKVLADPPPGAEYLVLGSDQRDVPAAAAGRLAGKAIEEAVRMALAGEVAAVVTAPIEKHAFHLGGYTYPGHTEFLAALAGNVEVAMMLASDRLRVVLVTTHIPLKAVPAAVTTEKVVTVGRLATGALVDWWRIPVPRLAICALNPHAGEAGMFGTEDGEILAPAAKALRCAGPLPADTVFVRAMRGEFDAVLAPYHDVGMTAIKVASFGQAVNITLGLPFIRTSPDHGTALDIAGKGVADPSSMREAVRLAVELATRRGARGQVSGFRGPGT
ncbi:MAG: 4-hydroxythreonine-4-phosphate dehydrogenase PdxA [Gemmatimonadetes bacterium]|nr:4-hydroxythreonine-4-phosphate dehydrogenase PdxA [Gemmatimonadota bacterium]